jgi:hypothetical protein
LELRVASEDHREGGGEIHAVETISERWPAIG